MSWIAAVAGFVLFLVVMVGLRMKLGNRFEIKTADIVVAFIPIVLWLIFSDRLSEFKLGDFSMAFKSASQAAISQQIKKIELFPTRPLVVTAKATRREIPKLLDLKTEALTFQLGSANYDPMVIGDYLNQLTQGPLFELLGVHGCSGAFPRHG